MSEIGATGEFPQGKLTASDKGELGFRVFHLPGKIVVEFRRADHVDRDGRRGSSQSGRFSAATC
jgi:hypothetical protein